MAHAENPRGCCIIIGCNSISPLMANPSQIDLGSDLEGNFTNFILLATRAHVAM